MKLGYIDYLNCYPFYYHMFEKEPLENISVHPDYPSSLNALMKSGGLDMSPISSGAYPDIAGDVLLVPDFCLSSVGYVGSVNLISKLPIESLDKKRIGVTSASATSVALMKVLLGKFYNLSPEYVPSPPMPDMADLDAALMIGNEAMKELPQPVSFKYDLGELWNMKTGFPAVFAVLSVQKKAVADHEKQVMAVIESYRKSIACMKTEKAAVVAGARERYPDIMYDIDFYYSLFQYDFNDHLRKALLHYFSLASDMGLMKKVDRLEFV